MPDMRPPLPVALAVADIHLSMRAPIARSAEDWLPKQIEYLKQLQDLACSLAVHTTQVPVLLAGDLFDRWNAPAELINLALAHLPQCYGVCGQHDLPHHRLDQMHRSAFGTLVRAGKITYLEPGQHVQIIGQAVPLLVRGFPWGTKVTPLDDPHDLALDIAVVHAYCWTHHTGHPGADERKHLNRWKKRLRGYDIAVFGDNHIPFTHTPEEGCAIYNCGSFMRRKTDEADHRPSIGVIYSDGSIKRHRLDVSKDVLLTKADVPQSTVDAEDFLNELTALGDGGVSFEETMRRALEVASVSDAVRETILKAMEAKK